MGKSFPPPLLTQTNWGAVHTTSVRAGTHPVAFCMPPRGSRVLEKCTLNERHHVRLAEVDGSVTGICP